MNKESLKKLNTLLENKKACELYSKKINSLIDTVNSYMLAIIGFKEDDNRVFYISDFLDDESICFIKNLGYTDLIDKCNDNSKNKLNLLVAYNELLARLLDIKDLLK